MAGPDPSLSKAQAERAESAASQPLPLTGASTNHSPRAHVGLSTAGDLASELVALVRVCAWIHVLLPIPERLSVESKLLSLCVAIRQHCWSRQSMCSHLEALSSYSSPSLPWQHVFVLLSLLSTCFTQASCFPTAPLSFPHPLLLPRALVSHSCAPCCLLPRAIHPLLTRLPAPHASVFHKGYFLCLLPSSRFFSPGNLYLRLNQMFPFYLGLSCYGN